MPVLEARGLFWWADEPIPEGHSAPPSYKSGLLKIDDDGGCSLELDGYLSGSTFEPDPIPKDKCIQGLLKGSNQQVLLLDLMRGPAEMTTRGISYETYIAPTCLIADREALPRARKFKRILIPLSGYEDWLRLRAIKINRRQSAVSAKYKKPKDWRYRLSNGSLSIQFSIEGHSSGGMFGTEVLMKAKASACLVYNKPLSLDEIKTHYQLFEDLMVLMTSTHYPLDWPSVSIRKKQTCRLYFKKSAGYPTGSSPKVSECVVNFVQLQHRFGSVWQEWRNKREKLGPGLYLYLGTRRGFRLYTEHRFVNLVWGIEAFHRRRYEAASQPSRLKEKIERILRQISASKDRKWLAGKLENAHEPSLGERICEAISAVPLGLEAGRLREFSERCAQLRNDISHFGGQRHDKASYNDFIIELSHQSEALDTLYQMLLLHDVGVEDKILKWWVFEGYQSYPIKYYFVQVGLLEKSAIDPKQSTAQAG